MQPERRTQTTDEWLDTGEPIRVVERYDGRFQATAEVAIAGHPIDHHAIGTTPEEARDRLRRYVAQLRRGMKGTHSIAGGEAPPLPPLKACRCGGEGALHHGRLEGIAGSQGWEVSIRCRRCGLRTGPVQDGLWRGDGEADREAAEAWNRLGVPHGEIGGG